MKFIKIKIPLLAIVIAAFFVVVANIGLGQTANAYICYNPSNPSNNPATGDVYEYHDDGQCYKVRYSPDNTVSVPSSSNVGGNLTCPGGGAPSAGTNHDECAVSCPNGEVAHDDNTCWKQNGYTVQDTNKIAPTHNDGTPLTPADGGCSDGYDFLNAAPPGSGGNGAGCYKKASDGTYPCKADQDVSENTNIDSGQTSIDCGDTGNSHLRPTNPTGTDATNCVAAAGAKVGNTCKPFSDFTNRGDCESHGGFFNDLGPNATGGGEHYECQSTAITDPANPDNPANQQQQQQGQTVDPPAAKETFGSCGTHGDKDKPVETVLIGCDAGVCNTGGGGWSGAFKGTPVIACIIKFGVSALTVLVGVGAVAGIAWEAFKYAKAQDDQGAVSDARKRMRDIVIGLIVYIFMAVAINWLVPGGVIGG